MVMSSAFDFRLKNGQRLRFAGADTLHQFLKDPVGLSPISAWLYLSNN